MKISCVVAALNVVLAVSDAMAQTCLGYPSFDAGRVQLGASVNVSEAALSMAGGVAFGSRGPFGGLSLGTTRYDEVGGSTFVVGAGVGYQLTRPSRSRFQGCLGAGGTLGSGPHDVAGSGENAFSYTFIVGATIGVVLGGSSVQRLVPTLGIGFAGSRFQASRKQLWTSVFDRSDKFWVLDLGAGFIVSRVLAVRPSVAIPLGLDDANPVLGLSVALHLGRRR